MFIVNEIILCIIPVIQNFKSLSSCLFPNPVTIIGTQTFTFKENPTGLFMHTTLAKNLQSVLQVQIISPVQFIETMGIVI